MITKKQYDLWTQGSSEKELNYVLLELVTGEVSLEEVQEAIEVHAETAEWMIEHRKKGLNVAFG